MAPHDPIKKETSSQASADGSSGEPEPLFPRAYRISEVCQRSGLGRTSVYAAIKSGELVARKWNRCTIVLADDLAAFLRSLPQHR
jgi:hypothetical protein